jgi:hypothetical protein
LCNNYLYQNNDPHGQHGLFWQWRASITSVF